jgi:aspartokinase-like uncharacterized kinase
MNKPTIVVKVGGSLMDWPELGPRLKEWLASLSTAQILLIPGGGPTVDVVRDLDRWHQLGEESAHWLALRALTLNAHFLAGILPSFNPMVVADFRDCKSVWSNFALPVLDPFSFARNDEGLSNHLPHHWTATSDSLAARVAWRIGAQKLILLKSVPGPQIREWWSNSDFVDPLFAKTVSEAARVGNPMEISAINLRERPKR